MSQPFIGALMLDLLGLESGQTVLEVGTGLGYQAALMAELGTRVWSVEIVEEFAGEAALRLLALGYSRRLGAGRRRLARLARSCSVRPHPGHRRRQRAAAAADRAAAPRRPHGAPARAQEVQQLSVIDKDLKGGASIGR